MTKWRSVVDKLRVLSTTLRHQAMSHGILSTCIGSNSIFESKMGQLSGFIELSVFFSKMLKIWNPAFKM